MIRDLLVAQFFIPALYTTIRCSFGGHFQPTEVLNRPHSLYTYTCAVANDLTIADKIILNDQQVMNFGNFNLAGCFRRILLFN